VRYGSGADWCRTHWWRSAGVPPAPHSRYLTPLPIGRMARGRVAHCNSSSDQLIVGNRLAAMRAATRGPENSPFLSRSVREVEPKVTRTPIDVHAAFPKNVATNQNVIGREVIEHGKVTDELNPIFEPN